jgi:hypothetical protein
MKGDYRHYDGRVQHLPYGAKAGLALGFFATVLARGYWVRIPPPCSHNGGFQCFGRFLLCLILWFLGLVSSYTLGGYIHILIVVALIVLVINLVTGRRGAA